MGKLNMIRETQEELKNEKTKSKMERHDTTRIRKNEMSSNENMKKYRNPKRKLEEELRNAEYDKNYKNNGKTWRNKRMGIWRNVKMNCKLKKQKC